MFQTTPKAIAKVAAVEAVVAVVDSVTHRAATLVVASFDSPPGRLRIFCVMYERVDSCSMLKIHMPMRVSPELFTQYMRRS